MNPTDRELEILKILWEIGEGNVRAVHERMTEGEDLHFNTIQTQLRIMDRKGLVKHHREGRTMVYTPVYTREQESKRFLQQVFDGSVSRLMLSLLNVQKVDAETLAELEKMIKQARKK